jgi:hypothetical protein
MTTAFQYGSLVVAHSRPTGAADWPDLVQRLVEYIQRNLDERPEPGWELVSHDMMIVDEEIFVTFFIRRPNRSWPPAGRPPPRIRVIDRHQQDP